MGVPFDQVKVVHGDTRVTPFSLIGTGGSRAATWASGAVLMSTRKVKEKVLAIAGELLEISSEDLEIADGVISPRCAAQDPPARSDRHAGDHGARQPARGHATRSWRPRDLPGRRGHRQRLVGRHPRVHVEVDLDTGRSTSCAMSSSRTAAG